MVSLFFGRVASSTKFIRCLQCYANMINQRSFSSSVFEARRLDSLIVEAEKVVGYPTSLLRCLLSDEISSVLVHSKKLVGSRHPLVKTARRLVYEGADGFEAIGLIVLLISRVGETLMTESPPLGHEIVSGIQRNQRKLAEVAELINTGYLVHLGVVNKASFQSSDDFKVMNFGNKISILTGDFLLAKASVGLSELENTQVVNIMAGVFGDIVEGETLKDYGVLKDMTWNNWEDIVFRSRGSLFAKSCLSALKLSSLSQMRQDEGFSFGKHLAFLQQLHKDYQTVNSDAPCISITNAAVLLTKETLPEELLEKENNSPLIIDESARNLLRDINVKVKMENLCRTYGHKALKSLDHFPCSEARTCLENLVKHLTVLV